MNDQQFAQFLINGFVAFRDDNLLSTMRPDQLEFRSVYGEYNPTDEHHFIIPPWLHEASKYLLAQYIAPVFPYGAEHRIGYWEGVDKGTTEWHSDHSEGHDITVLVYLDTMEKNTGGAIHFRSNCVDDMCIYPSSGDIICFTHTNGVEHRADIATTPRRVIGFEYRRLA